MAVDISIPVSTVDEVIGTAADQFDNIRLYRADSRGGTYTLLTTIALVSGTTEYTYSDTSGISTSWYKVTFYNSTLVTETPLSDAEPFPAAVSLMTLAQLRQKLVQNFGGKVLTPDTVLNTNVTAASLIDGSATDYLNGWHLYRPSIPTIADQDRRITSGPSASGVVVVAGNNYTDTTNATIELMPLDISLTILNAKIGDGLYRARYLYRYEFGAVSGQKQFDLPTFIEDPAYVEQIWHRYGSTADQWIWRTFDTGGLFARVRGGARTCKLDISPALGANDVIGLDVWRAGEPLSGETDETNVHPIWAEAVCMVSVLNWLVNRDMLRHGNTKYDKALGLWTKEVHKAQKAYGQTTQLKMQLPQPWSSFPEV